MKKSFFLCCVALLSMLISCKKNKIPDGMNAKDEMRNFVIGISNYSKAINTNFSIIPQNGLELVSNSGQDNGDPSLEYLLAIDGNGQEDLYYGYDNDDQATKTSDNDYLRNFIEISKDNGNTILVTDYCSTESNITDSYNKNTNNGYVSFQGDQRELNNIPVFPNPINNENNDTVVTLSEIQNFLYLINPENFSSKNEYINAINATNYDLLIMDLFFHDGQEFSSSEIDLLKTKANGGKRLLICYMSIGEAEDYRYYWETNWNTNKPSWLDSENPNWEGNFKVKYWESDWKNIIYGNDNSYLKKVLDANFDGVYLDIIDAFEHFE